MEATGIGGDAQENDGEFFYRQARNPCPIIPYTEGKAAESGTFSAFDTGTGSGNTTKPTDIVPRQGR